MKSILPAVTLAVVIADQITKWAARHFLMVGGSFPVFDGVFHITLVENRGVAFGLFQGYPYVFAVISAVTVALVLFLFSRSAFKGILFRCSAGLVAGGAVGNLIDRFWRGYVVDFFDFRIWPVFNIADSAITIGAALVIWHLLSSNRKGAQG